MVGTSAGGGGGAAGGLREHKATGWERHMLTAVVLYSLSVVLTCLSYRKLRDRRQLMSTRRLCQKMCMLTVRRRTSLVVEW